MASVSPPRACALLKAWREREKLTQEQAAALVGVRQGTLSDWENNKGQPQIAAAVKLELVTGGEVPVTEWLPPEEHEEVSSHAAQAPRKAKRRRGGGGSSGSAPTRTGLRASRSSKKKRPAQSGVVHAITDHLRCRVCGCSDAAPCPGGCAWYTPELCTTCADILEQLLPCVTRDGRKEDDLVRHLAHAFEEQLEDQAEAYVRKALDDLLGRGVLRRDGGRLWKSPPTATSRRARRGGAEASP